MVVAADPAVSALDTVAAERPRPPRVVLEVDYMMQETECAP